MEKATERQRILLRHLQPSSSSDASLSASACLSKDSAAYQYGDDVVIVALSFSSSFDIVQDFMETC
jgi:acetyl-CoA acyltransferase 1